MNKRLKALVFIESDAVIRNFVNAGAFTDLVKKHDVTFVFPHEGYNRIKSELSEQKLGAPFVRINISERRVLMWKWMMQADQLKFRFSKHRRELRKTNSYLLGWKASLLLTVAGLPIINTLFNAYIQHKMKDYPCDELEALIDHEKPDVLIHPSTFDGFFISDLHELGPKKGVPTALVMNSWDNPSLKKSMAGLPDWVAVWGEQTKNHTLKYMGVREDRIVKLGAAQFDIFRNKPRISREEFCTEHSISPTKRILIYAGSSRETDEYSQLIDLDNALASGELENAAVVYRPHPGGAGGAGGERILDYPWKHIVIETSMREYLEYIRNGNFSLYMAEYYRTHDVLTSIDALMSPMSTIILEAAIHGKPVMCILDDDSQINLYKGLAHFEDMFNSEFILVSETPQQLISRTQDLLEKIGDPIFKKNIITEANFFVEQPSLPYCEALSEFVETVYTSHLETIGRPSSPQERS